MTNLIDHRTRFCALVTSLAITLFLGLAVPAAGQYEIYDLGQAVTTHDIQADNANNVHVVWTYAGHLYYGKIVNHALTGKVDITPNGPTVGTVYWRPYVSVQPDGSSVHVLWTTTQGHANSLMHSWKTSGPWLTETVTTVPSTQWLSQPACAVDGSGIVHAMFVIWNDTSNQWSTIFYQRKLASGQWEAREMFTPQTPEYKHPMMFTDSTGRVHATWDIAGRSGTDSFDAYYCTAPSGGRFAYANTIRLPKRSDNNVSGYGDLYVDRQGVVHRSVGGYSNSVGKMCIDHTKKPVGGTFAAPTRASLGFLDLSDTFDPVPAVVAGEDGRTIVAWGEVSPSGASSVKASFYDPDTRSWSIYTIDPAAGVPERPNAYRVALTRTDTEVFGIWRGAAGRIMLFALPISGVSLALTAPNGGERWQAGETYNITWNQSDLSGNATLALYKGGTKAADIGTASVTAGTYSWDIPRSTAAGSDYRVRITQGSTVDESNADFSIAEANSPNIVLSPTSLRFGAATTGAKTASQSVLLSDSKGGILHWTATRSNTWINVSPDSGSGNDVLTIGVNPVGFGAGTYTGTVSIADPYAVNTPQVISVTMEVLAATAAPVGAFESPKNNASVKGTIPLSGWALDDLGVAKLEIRRSPLKGETPDTRDGLVYVGDAGFVAGARSDIESGYSSFPQADRAAWGYMLNTYALPGAGNGTFVLHAVAYDVEGNGVEVGTRTIKATDKYNTKPFGLVDAPDWGESISGTAYANTAWMLTPRPKIISTKGTTIWVWIDGVKVAHPVYNQPRSDIAALFPTLRNKSGPGGTLTIDTTRYANGLHTIKWVALDSGGASGNTGTSYFTVLNVPGAGGLAASSPVSVLGQTGEGTASLSGLAWLPADLKSPILARTGFAAETEYETVFPDASGAILAVPADDRIELQLNDSASSPENVSFAGYLAAGDELRSLPAGSTLDAARGAFTWQPGPGYYGTYNLVFIRLESGHPASKRLVTVRVGTED
jgi:hypothetical protein